MGIRTSDKILNGPVAITLLKMSLPMMVGLVGVVSLNLIDAYFIGKLGSHALAAIGYTFPAILLQGAISGGLGVGTSAIVSRAIGEKNNRLVKRLTTDSLILSIIVVTLLVIIGEYTIEPLFNVMGADQSSMLMIKDYMEIWYLGLPFVVIPMVGNGAIRATGNTIIPATVMIVAMVTNGILDPIMIFGLGPIPAMGIKGAAFATVIARCFTMFISLGYLIFRLKMIDLIKPKLTELFRNWKSLMHIGLPAGITKIFLPLSMGFITRLVSGYGKDAVAAMGIGLKVEMFSLVPIIALSTVMIPFIGQNLGAGNYNRIKKGHTTAIYFSLIWGVILFISFLFFGKNVGSIFNSNTDIHNIIYNYLIIASTGYGLLGIIEVSSAIFNVLHKPFSAAALHFFRMAILYIPLAILGSNLFGLSGIFMATAVSGIFTGSVAILWINKTLKNIKKSSNQT